MTFSAAVSDPGAEDRLTYFWSFGDGTTSTSVSPSKVYVDDGTFEVSLTVSDGDGGSSSATASLTVLNAPPTIAILNVPALGDEGASLGFSAFVSDPGTSDTLTFFWDFGDGIVQDGVALSSVTHTYLSEGDYTVTLTVQDDDGGSVQDAGAITINNVAPLILELSGPATGDEGDTFSFEVSATDPGNDPLSYAWDFGDGTTGTGAAVSHVFTDDGTYDVVVTVSDDDGAATSTALQVAVANVAPIIQSITGPSSADEGDQVTFAASVIDPGDDTVTYVWDFGDGTSGEGLQVSHTYADNGVYNLLLEASDEDGGISVASGSLEVLNVPPTIVSLEGPTTGNQGQVLQYTAAATDPGQDMLTYAWDFGDGTEEQGVDLTSVTHTYQGAGAYALVLTVSDEDGGHVTAERTVNIDNGAPGISRFDVPTSALEGDLVQMTVSAEDPGGDPLVYTWDFGDGGDPVAGEGLDSVTHAYRDEGSYVVEVRVSDPGGLEARASRTIGVENAPPAILSRTVPETVEEGEVFVVEVVAEDPGVDDVVTCVWDFGDETGEVSGLSVSHAYVQNGTYTIRVIVSDDDGGAVMETFSLPVTNVPPVIHELSGPRSLNEGQEGTWLADVVDPGADTLSYNWAFGDGLTTTEVEAVHAYSREGTYTLSLVVTDQDGGMDSLEIEVAVSNLPPVLEAVTIPTNGNEGDGLTFSVTASDPGGGPLAYAWDFGDGKGGSDATVIHAYADDGTYQAAVTVTDETGTETRAEGTVVIANLPPEAAVPGVPASAGEGESVEVAVSFSDPGPGDVLTASLIWGDGSSSPVTSGEPAFHAFVDEGTYEIRLKVADDDGAIVVSDPATIEVVNLPPTIVSFSGTLFGQVGETFSFTAQATDPGEEDLLIFTYDWGDGTTPDSGEGMATATHQYTAVGNYQVTLTVTDGDGGEAAATLAVNVETGAPYFVAFDVPTQGNEAEPLLFSAQARDSADQPLVYTWDFGDGTATITGEDQTEVAHTYSDDGTYLVKVTVIDPDELTAFRSAEVLVRNLPPVILSDPPPGEAREGTRYVHQVEAEDPAGEVDPLTFSLQDAPEGMAISDSGLIEWTPTLEQAEAGEIAFAIVVSDDDGGTTEQAVQVQVFFVDEDMDGMPDSWEALNGLDPGRDDADEDLDGDGISNLEEYLAGSDPDSSNAPGPPDIVSPPIGSEVAALPVTLQVGNASDVDGDALTYSFELYEDAALSILLASAREVQEGEETTAWQPGVPLLENHAYWWRARAYDGKAYGPWSEVADFRINVHNEPPSAPVVSAPLDGDTVDDVRPVLEVVNATDPDGSVLTYGFEVFDEEGTRVAWSGDVAEEADGTTGWMVEPALTWDTGYTWHARAADPQGLVSPWTEQVSFFVAQGNAAPEPPTILEPADGSRVGNDQPTLVVANAWDPDGDLLEYQFELDRSPTFDTDALVQSGPVAEGEDGRTSWQAPGALEENAVYVWRVSATDGQAWSEWVVADFRVDTVNDPPGVPVLQNPSDGAVVAEGSLSLSLVPTQDPDGEAVTYTFLVRREGGDPVWEDPGVEAPAEGLVATTLDTADLPDDTYQFAWTAFATDARGLSGPEAEANHFEVQRSGTVTPHPGDETPGVTPEPNGGDCACDASSRSPVGGVGGAVVLVMVGAFLAVRRARLRSDR